MLGGDRAALRGGASAFETSSRAAGPCRWRRERGYLAPIGNPVPAAHGVGYAPFVQPPGPPPPYPPQGPPPPYPPQGPPPGPYPPPGAFTPPPIGAYGYPPPAPPQPSGEAIAALVCGLLAFSCFPLGFVAIWLGMRARQAARDYPDRVGGEQMALIGMIVGGIIGTLYLLFFLAYIVMIVFAIGFSIKGP